jgi:hypothetical protein
MMTSPAIGNPQNSHVTRPIATPSLKIQGILLELIPSNIIAATAQQKVPSTLVFAALFGFGLTLGGAVATSVAVRSACGGMHECHARQRLRRALCARAAHSIKESFAAGQVRAWSSPARRRWRYSSANSRF